MIVHVPELELVGEEVLVGLVVLAVLVLDVVRVVRAARRRAP